MNRFSEESAHTQCLEHDLCARVQAEFREMRGLKLTLPQAARIFSIEPARCARVLDALVRAGQLKTDGITFAISGGGRLRA